MSDKNYGRSILSREMYDAFCKAIPNIFSNASTDVEYQDIARIKYENNDSTQALEIAFLMGTKFVEESFGTADTSTQYVGDLTLSDLDNRSLISYMTIKTFAKELRRNFFKDATEHEILNELTLLDISNAMRGRTTESVFSSTANLGAYIFSCQPMSRGDAMTLTEMLLTHKCKKDFY